MRSKLAGVGGFVVLVGAAIGLMVFLHERDAGNQAEDHAKALVAAAHGAAKPEATLASFDALITGEEWANLDDAMRGTVGAEVVRLAAELVPKPFTQRHVDDANRVVARYRALPDAGRHGAARDAMLSTLEGWIKGLPAAVDREARIALLRLELAVADGNDTLSIAPRLATERLEMARAIADAWPVDALGFLAEEPRDPAGVPEAGKILGRLVEQPALLVDAGGDVDAWLVSVPSDDPQRKAIEAQRELGRTTKAEDDAETDPAQMRAKLAKRTWDQWLVVKLANADLGAGDLAAAEKRLRAIGAPGMMVRDATFLLGRIALAQGQLEEADQVMTGLLGSRLQRFLAASTNLEAAAKFLQDRMTQQLRSGNLPPDIRAKLEAAPEAERTGVIQDWLGAAFAADPEVQRRREVLMSYGEVVPASIALGTIKLQRAQLLGGPARDAMLGEAERAFLAVRTAAAGQPEFHLGLGEIYARLGKTKESEEELQGVLGRKEAELSLRVAQVYRAIGNERRAIEVATDVQATGNTPFIQQTAAALLGVMARTDEDRERWYRKADVSSAHVQTALLEIEGRRLMRQGKGAECDKKFAEAVKLTLKGASPTDHAAINNAALAHMQRFQCTGDLSVLREAEASLERAYRGASDQPIVIANLASMLRTNADVRVLAKRINVGALRLAGDDAMQLVTSLLDGPERAAILADLAADPGWRRSAELFAQYAVLAPSSTLTYADAMDRALRSRDDAAAAAVVEQLRRAKSLDTSSADAAYHRRVDGTALATEEAEILGTITRDTEILAGKLDDRSRAAALVRQADNEVRYGTIWNHPEHLAAAINHRAEAAKLWPALTDETSVAEALLDQAALGADALRWSKLRRERGGAATLARLVAAKDPLVATIRGSSTWAEVANHLRAAARQRPEIDDLWLARLVDDPAISAWASKVIVDKVERLRFEAFSIMAPTDPRWAEGLALLAQK